MQTKDEQVSFSIYRFSKFCGKSKNSTISEVGIFILKVICDFKLAKD